MRTPSATRSHRRERGAAAVEFVLVAPVLFVVLLGMLEASRMMVARCMLTYAVSVGARMGLAKSNTNTSTIKTAVVNAAPMLGLSTGSVSVATSAASWTARTSGNTVTVTYTGYTFTPIAGPFTKLASKTFNATSMETIP